MRFALSFANLDKILADIIASSPKATAVGPTAVAFGEDAIMSARILSKFAKDNENLKLIGGLMDNEVLDQAGVLNVANLPTLDEARANIVGILNASASKLVSILLARSEKMSNLPAENSETQPKE